MLRKLYQNFDFWPLRVRGAEYENLLYGILRPEQSFTAWHCACYYKTSLFFQIHKMMGIWLSRVICTIQGDLSNSDECFFGNISKISRVQWSIIVQKKRNSIAFYLVPGIKQSVQQFSHNTPKRKSLDCCEKITEPIFSSQVPNKMLLNSAPFSLQCTTMLY